MFHSIVKENALALGVDAVVRACQVGDDGPRQVGGGVRHVVLLGGAGGDLQQAGRVVGHVADEAHHQRVVSKAQLGEALEGDDLRRQGAQPVLVQQQGLEVLEVGDAGGEGLELIVAEHQHLQPRELPQRGRHLGELVATQAEHGQSHGPADVVGDGLQLVAAQVEVLEARHVQHLRRELCEVVPAQVELLEGGGEGLGQGLTAQPVVPRDEGRQPALGQPLGQLLEAVAAHVQDAEVGEAGHAGRHGAQPILAQDEVLDVLGGVGARAQALQQARLHGGIVQVGPGQVQRARVLFAVGAVAVRRREALHGGAQRGRTGPWP